MEKNQYIIQMKIEIKEQSEKEGVSPQVRYLASLLDSWIQEDDLAERFQEGEWTLESLWKRILEYAKRKATGGSYGCADDEVKGWVKQILHGEKPKDEPKKEVQKAQDDTEAGQEEPNDKKADKVQAQPRKRADKPRKDGFEQIALFDL